MAAAPQTRSRAIGGSSSAARESTDATLAAVAIVAATMIGFSRSLALGWWREDYSWLFGPVRWSTLLTRFANPDTLGRFRPLAKLLFALVGSLGLDARLPSRLVCVVLLASGAVLLARWVTRLSGDSLAGGLAGLLYLASPRIVVIGTWLTLWSAQLYVIFAALALAALTAPADAEPTARPHDRRLAPGAAVATVLAFVAALASFEVAVNLPLAAAVLLIGRGRRDRRAWLAVAVGLALAAALSMAHVLDPDAPGSHHPSIAAVGRNLLAAADHESAIAVPAAFAAAYLLARRRWRRTAGTLIGILAGGLVPGVLFPLPPDTYLFLLSYLAGAALVGVALADLTSFIPIAARSSARRAVLAAAATAAALLARSSVGGLVEREWEMRESRALVDALVGSECLGHQPATIAPLGIDERDRRHAFTTAPGEPTVLSRLCGAPVVFALDPLAVAEPECRANAHFLTRDGDLVGCSALAEAPEAMAAAVACGVPLDSPSLLRPGGVWSGPRLLCVNVPRGEGITDSDPPVVLEGDQALFRKTSSLSFASPEDGTRFTARLDRVRTLGPRPAGQPKPPLGTITVYADQRIVSQVPLDRDDDEVGIDVPTGGAAVLTVWYQALAEDGPGLVLFQPRFPKD